MIWLSLTYQTRGWQLDPRSLLVGVGLGLLLGALLIFVIWPRAVRLKGWATARWRQFLDRFRSSAEERYRGALAQYAATHHAYGAGLDLAAFFVAPRLWQPATVALDGVGPMMPPEHLYWIWPETASRSGLPLPPLTSMSALLRQGERVLIAGEPGVGKTTLLAEAARLAAAPPKDGPMAHLAARLPLFLHAADLAAADWPDDVAGLLAAVPQALDVLQRRGLEELLQARLNAGSVLLLLDGADELAPESLERMADWLSAWLARHPQMRVMVAGPASGYAPFLSLGFVLTGLAPWQEPQAEALCLAWSQNLNRAAIATREIWQPGQAAWQTATRLALRRVRAEDEPEPPRWVGRLEMALRGHLPAAEGDPPWLAPLCRDLWQQMALEIVSTGRLSLPDARFGEMASVLLDQYAVNTPLSLRRLRAAAEASGLLVAGNDHWRFLSPIWRDFLAAARLVQDTDDLATVPWIHRPGLSSLRRLVVARIGPGDQVDSRLADTSTIPEGLFEVSAWMPEALQNGAWRRTVLLRLGKLALNEQLPVALRQRAILALAQTGEPGVLTVLRQLLSDRTLAIQQIAIGALPLVPDDQVLELLVASFDTDEPAVQRAVMGALAWLPHDGAQTVLVRGLLAPDPLVQRAAAESLALKGGADAEILREAAAEDAADVRRAAVFGLALVDADWALALLRELRRDDQWIVQSAAEAALALRLDGEETPPSWRPALPAALPWLQDWAADKGRSVPDGPAAIPLLLEALRPDEPVATRQAALRTLALMGMAEAAPTLAEAAVDPDPQIRETAFAAQCVLSRAHGAWIGL